MVEVCEPDDPERPVLALGDEDEIQDPDDALVDQVGQDGQALPGHFRTWELDDQVADRTQSTVVGHLSPPSFWTRTSASDVNSQPEPWSFVLQTRRRSARLAL